MHACKHNTVASAQCICTCMYSRSYVHTRTHTQSLYPDLKASVKTASAPGIKDSESDVKDSEPDIKGSEPNSINKPPSGGDNHVTREQPTPQGKQYKSESGPSFVGLGLAGFGVLAAVAVVALQNMRK
jgi:hypothetical protein